MRREERQLVRYRAMFRHYPDALTPSQVQELSLIHISEPTRP